MATIQQFNYTGITLALLAFSGSSATSPSFQSQAAVPTAALDSPFRAVDLDVGESASVQLANGTKVEVKLLDLQEKRDPIRHAVRDARVMIEVGGTKLTIPSAGYHLPVQIGAVQVDCPVTRGFVQHDGNYENPWALDKATRLRF